MDKSYIPCKRCNHFQKDHAKHYNNCYACNDAKYLYGSVFSCWGFVRPDNLEYFKWLYDQTL